MSDTVWIIVILVLVAALVYGAFLLGRASAMREAGTRRTDDPLPAPAREASAPVQPTRSPSAAPPPASAGGDRAPSAAPSGATPPRRAAPPPASAAGPSSGSASAAPNAPRRTAAPPPAQAAWDTPKNGGKG